MLVDDLRAWLANSTPPAIPGPPLAMEAPPLHDLVVVVPPLPEDREVTEDRLLELYRQRLYDLAPRRVREVGDFAREGDEVRVRMAFFHEGKALAFTAVDRETLIAGRPWTVPGVGEALVGATCKELSQIRATFPDDHPARWLRGISGTWRVRVLEIVEVQQPDPDDPDLLPSLGIEVDLEQLMVDLREEAIDAMALELREQATTEVLDLLRARAPTQIPRELVERELWTRWAETEGRVLLDLGAGESDLNLSLAAWLRDDLTFADAERRVHISALLAAIAERDGVRLSHEALQEHLEAAAAMMGVDPLEAKRSMREDPAQRQAFEQNVYHLVLVEHVMQHARVRYLA